MNRCAHLQPLSNDHHYALLAACRLMEKLGEGDETREIAAFARRLWREHFAHHFEQEEEHVVPALRAVGLGNLARQILEEHKSIRDQVRDLSPNGADRRDALLQLAADLHSHARFEEREAFPELEEHANDDMLEVIGGHLYREVPESRWEPMDWP